MLKGKNILDRIRVHKFGGSSVGNSYAIKNVANILRSDINNGYQPVAVVSALYGVTNRLLKLHQSLLKNDHKTIDQLTSEISTHHLNEAKKLFGASSNELFDYEQFMNESFTNKISLFADKINNKSTFARISSLGEHLSAPLIASYINTISDMSKTSADAFHGEDIIYTKIDQNGYHIPSLIESKTNSSSHIIKSITNNSIPIIGGFAARCLNTQEITTLGRGGSDLSATVIGAILNAKEVHLWKVEGIKDSKGYLKGWKKLEEQKKWTGVLTASPNTVKEAECIPKLSYTEAQEFCNVGKTVLHPATVQPVRNANIPIHIRNTSLPTVDGTQIGGKSTNSLKGIVSHNVDELPESMKTKIDFLQNKENNQTTNNNNENENILAIVGNDVTKFHSKATDILNKYNISAKIQPVINNQGNCSLLIAVQDAVKAQKILHQNLLKPTFANKTMSATA